MDAAKPGLVAPLLRNVVHCCVLPRAGTHTLRHDGLDLFINATKPNASKFHLLCCYKAVVYCVFFVFLDIPTYFKYYITNSFIIFHIPDGHFTTLVIFLQQRRITFSDLLMNATKPYAFEFGRYQSFFRIVSHLLRKYILLIWYSFRSMVYCN